MEVLIEGLTSDATPMVLPAKDFKVEVSQDGVTQTAKVRIIKFTMTREMNPESSNRSVQGNRFRSQSITGAHSSHLRKKHK